MNREYLDYFPKKSPYTNQLEAMDAIYGALGKRQIVLFEGACGTGKTLSALTPALYIAKKEKKTVVIATNVDEQMYQFIEEAKEIKRQKDIKVIVFKGKKKMCPLQMDYDKCNTLKENTYKLIDLEKEIEHLKDEIKEINKKLQHDKDKSLIEHQKFLSFEIDQNEISITELRKNSCDKLLELLKHDKGYFYEWVFTGVRTPEEILDWASENNCCGYELLKKFIKEVDLLICNYNHFIDEELRANVLDLLDKKLEDILIIFDEAHNILNNARDKSPKLTETDIKKVIEEINSKRDTLFCWDEVPGKDEDKFIKHLNECFCIDWIGLPKISKSENRGSITITDGNKTFCFELDTSNNDVKLVSDNIVYKYFTKKDENQLKIYRFPEPSKYFGAFLSVFKDTIRSKYIDPIKDEINNTEWNDGDIQITKKGLIQERIDTFKIEFISALRQHGIKNYDEVILHMKNFGAIIDEINNRQAAEGKNYIKLKRRSKTSQIADFISNYMAFSEDIYYYPVINSKRKENDIDWRLELYSCIPTNITGPLFDGVHSAVLMSATLTPFEDIKMMLGIKRETHELAYGTTFPKEKRLSVAVSFPALFSANRAKPDIESRLTRILNDIIEESVGNVLIFFPTYDDARKFKNKLNNNLPILLDEKGVSAQKVRTEFFKIGESGKKAVLLSYILGTLTEGVDYKDNRCRTVVIVGIGYPNTEDNKKKADELACEKAFGDGWKYASTIPTIRKVRQAMGRVIRSGEDYGVRILLDERYTSGSVKSKGKYSVFNIFPKEERDEFVDVGPDRVKYSLMNFFNIINYYDKGLLAFNSRDWKIAIAAFEQVMTLDPGYSNASKLLSRAVAENQLFDYYSKGMSAINSRDWKIAIAAFEQVMTLDPGYRGASKLLSRAVAENQLFDYYSRGRSAFNSGEWGAAIAIFEQVMAINPGYLEASKLLLSAREEEQLIHNYSKGTSAFNSGDWGAAIAIFEQVMTINPRYRDASKLLSSAREEEQLFQYSKGMSAVNSGDWGTAIDAFEQVTKINPGYRDASKLLSHAVAENQLFYYYSRGRSAFNSGDWGTAIDAFEQVMKINPGYCDASKLLSSAREEEQLIHNYSKAMSAFNSGKWGIAIDAFEQVTRINPGYRDASKFSLAAAEKQLFDFYSKGMSAFNSGDWGTAIDAFEQVMKINPGYRDASKFSLAAAENQLFDFYSKGMSAFNSGKWGTAIDAFEQVTKINPGYRDASKLLSHAVAEKEKDFLKMFVLIPAGEFDMGSPSNEADRYSDEGPVHHVNIPRAFYMGKYEVTQKQWRDVMGNSPSSFKGDDLPVEQVSWNDVQEFIKKLNRKEGTGKYRLPSEAEWEYAARAGTTTRYSFSDDESKLDDYAWFAENSDGKTHPVGEKKPNPWGLYDMHGNVREWVQDSWHGDYNSAPTDGSSWESAVGSYRVYRGGRWNLTARDCRSANRVSNDPGYSYDNLGFRLLRDL